MIIPGCLRSVSRILELIKGGGQTGPMQNTMPIRIADVTITVTSIVCNRGGSVMAGPPLPHSVPEDRKWAVKQFTYPED